MAFHGVRKGKEDKTSQDQLSKEERAEGGGATSILAKFQGPLFTHSLDLGSRSVPRCHPQQHQIYTCQTYLQVHE